MSGSLEGKVVVVTGAGSGVGRGLALGFARDGAHVVGIGRTEASLAKTAAEAGADRMAYVVGDVAAASDVERLFALADERHGRVDVLVNNAAIYPKVRFLDQPMDELEQTLRVNVMGVARCCHRALPGMLERGFGRVINIGSFAFKAPIPTAVAYSASKGAVSALTHGIANEIDPARYPDVLVNELMPGIFRTRMTPDAERDPAEAYPYARALALLPRGGSHGEIFLMDELHDRHGGGGGGVRGKARRLLGKLRG